MLVQAACNVAAWMIGYFTAVFVYRQTNKHKQIADFCDGCIHLKMVDDMGKHCRRYMGVTGLVRYCADRRVLPKIPDMEVGNECSPNRDD